MQAGQRQVEEAMDAYVEWREECIYVSEAYERWARATAGEAGFAFAVYREALDREEHASRAYADRLTGMARLDLDEASP